MFGTAHLSISLSVLLCPAFLTIFQSTSEMPMKHKSIKCLKNHKESISVCIQKVFPLPVNLFLIVCSSFLDEINNLVINLNGNCKKNCIKTGIYGILSGSGEGNEPKFWSK